jgi:hypothetical protein
MKIFEQTYSDESLISASEDIDDAVFDENLGIPYDEYGFRKGTFKVVVTWSDEEIV